MNDEKGIERVHPTGERKIGGIEGPETSGSLDTFAGKVQVKWVPEAAVSSLGLMPYFIEFLKTSGVFDAWTADCPLEYSSPNAPQKRDVLGTILLSVLSGHWRYAHISGIRGDGGVNPDLLGMKKVASEDSVRRALLAMKEEESDRWGMKRHLKASYEPLLEERWILDMDSTVKPLYGHQEDAKLGYNPTKPGRPSHVYHTDFIANLRIVLEVEVQAGNQTATSYAQPGLWALLDGLNEKSRPTFLRGDCNWGSERAMKGAEERKIGYVFKLKQSAKVKKLIARLFQEDRWVDAGPRMARTGGTTPIDGMDEQAPCRDITPALAAKPRRHSPRAKRSQVNSNSWCWICRSCRTRGVLYEYAVVVTSLPDEVRDNCTTLSRSW